MMRSSHGPGQPADAGTLPAAAALRVDHLATGYGSRNVIEDLSLQGLQPGQVTALLGPNGSGKSTLLKALAGLAPLRRGRIALGDADAGAMAFGQRARVFSYMPQSLPAAVHLRVLESVLVAAHAQSRATQAPDLEAARAVLGRLGIEHLALHYLDELSGGQKQLAALAQALVRSPRVLMLDEPLSALDLNYQFHVMDLLRQETAARALVTVLVLHDINIALAHADHVIMLRDGALAGEGAPAQVISAATLARVYGVRARVEQCSLGRPYAVIDGLLHGGVDGARR
jgi:iron complex transport system ATP-binding protein